MTNTYREVAVTNRQGMVVAGARVTMQGMGAVKDLWDIQDVKSVGVGNLLGVEGEGQKDALGDQLQSRAVHQDRKEHTCRFQHVIRLTCCLDLCPLSPHMLTAPCALP